jgi:polyhydroxyalkanoate synthesis regulator phasin
MRMGSVTVGICALVTMVGLGSFLNVKATNEVEQAVKETKPAVEQKIEQTVENQYITNNNYETHNHYESNDNKEELKALEEKITKLEKEQKESDTGIVSVGVNEYGVVYNTQPQPVRDPWRGPRSYKCNKAAGYPAICGYCGEQGEIHHNIKEWQDTQGTYHLTHVGCGRLYCDTLGVEPRVEESYKVK